METLFDGFLAGRSGREKWSLRRGLLASAHAVAPRGGGRVATLAGCGAPRQADGVGTQAAFHAPNGLAVDAEGVLFVADSGNHCVRRVTPDGTVSTLAGDGCPSLTSTGLNSPCGLAVSSMPGRGTMLLIADRSNSCVRMLSIDALPPPLLAPSTMRQDLAALLDTPHSEDLGGEATFDVDGRLLRAPKAVLCARCPHFRAMVSARGIEQPIILHTRSLTATIPPLLSPPPSHLCRVLPFLAVWLGNA